MSTVIKALIALAALSFLAAVFVSLSSPLFEIPAEGFSRASTNLALIAIALAMTGGKNGEG
ncbi:MAG TPA: hypothetical protein VGA70_04840 [Longimicrobiales bacterium]|jgi:hypothetical protein